jgi:hypothetical protein
MTRSWLTPLVIAFWCVANGWLVVDKILPAFLSRPPSPSSAQPGDDGRYVPVAWSVVWDERPVGSAVSLATPLPDGGLSIDSRLDLRRLPLDELIPPWLKLLVRQTIPAGLQVSLAATGRVAIDAEGRLESFHSIVRLPETGETIFVHGTVTGGDIDVSIRAGDLRYETSRPLGKAALVTDELSPQAMLPGLTVGQRWTAPVFSPLRTGQSSIELLHAHVERETMTFDEDRPVTARLVTYRSSPTADAQPRLRMWVTREGRVIRQEAVVGASRILFLRRSDAEAAALAAALAPETTDAAPGPTPTGAP